MSSGFEHVGLVVGSPHAYGRGGGVDAVVLAVGAADPAGDDAQGAGKDAHDEVVAFFSPVGNPSAANSAPGRTAIIPAVVGLQDRFGIAFGPHPLAHIDQITLAQSAAAPPVAGVHVALEAPDEGKTQSLGFSGAGSVGGLGNGDLRKTDAQQQGEEDPPRDLPCVKLKSLGHAALPKFRRN